MMVAAFRASSTGLRKLVIDTGVDWPPHLESSGSDSSIFDYISVHAAHRNVAGGASRSVILPGELISISIQINFEPRDSVVTSTAVRNLCFWATVV
jgi:hypothetical protein